MLKIKKIDLTNKNKDLAISQSRGFSSFVKDFFVNYLKEQTST